MRVPQDRRAGRSAHRSFGRRWLPSAWLFAGALGSASAALADDPGATSPLLRSGYYVQAEAYAALFAQADDSSSPALLARAFGLGVRGGHRWHDKALFVALETAFWSAPVLHGQRQIAMATNVGIGGEYLAADGVLRTSLALGPSILTVPTDVDSGVSVGFFLDLRPLGLRFELGGGWLVGVDPVSLTLLMPELSSIPLVELEFRTSAYLERSL